MTQSLHLPAAAAEQRQRLLQLLAARAYRHGTFTLESPSGTVLLVDPWLEGNPKFPAGAEPSQIGRASCRERV